MTKKEYGYMDEETHLQLVVEQATEQAVCREHADGEYRLYDYDADGTRKTVIYAVTDEIPPDRSVILERFDTGEKFAVYWSVTVTRLEMPDDSVE